jgi:hypothetical protein
MLTPSFVQSLNTTTDSAYIVATSSSGLVVGSACLSDSCLDALGQTSLTVWGNDTFTNQIDGAPDGDTLNIQLIDGMQISDLSVTYTVGSHLVYSTNGLAVFINSVVESSCYYNINVGCTDTSACNYNSEAESDDGSCSYH